MTSHQEAAHPGGFDYEAGSPHLKHRILRSKVEDSLADEVGRIMSRLGRCRVLEVGAGHGSFTRVLRGSGARVTVTEMSGPSATSLEARFRDDSWVEVVRDPDGTWAYRTDRRYDLVAAISVLHHIPDYVQTVNRYVEMIEPGGTFLSWQDPMWYPSLDRASRVASRLSYYAWRLGQGDWMRGFATLRRRVRGILDETCPYDMAEYHVVRNGVGERQLESLLREEFAEVRLITYWSTQAATLQRVGDALGLKGTFALVARAHVAQDHAPAIASKP